MNNNILNMFKKREEVPATNPNMVAKALRQFSKILKPEYEHMRVFFAEGTHSFRILPPAANSRFPWMLPFEIYELAGCPEFVAPQSIDPDSGEDPISLFKRYMYNAHKDVMYTKADQNTPHTKIKLFPKRKAACWILHSQPELIKSTLPMPLHLLIGSNSSPDYGSEGFMHRIAAFGDAIDEDPDSPTVGQPKWGNIIDPETGRNIIAKVTGAGTAKNYELTPSSVVTRLETVLQKWVTDNAEWFQEHFVALEDTLLIPTEKEIIQYLERYLLTLGKAHYLNDAFQSRVDLTPQETTSETKAPTEKATPAPKQKTEVKEPEHKETQEVETPPTDEPEETPQEQTPTTQATINENFAAFKSLVNKRKILKAQNKKLSEGEDEKLNKLGDELLKEYTNLSEEQSEFVTGAYAD